MWTSFTVAERHWHCATCDWLFSSDFEGLQRLSYGYNCCELCCSRLLDGRSWGLPDAFELEDGAFGTGDWGIHFGDPEILNMAWSGGNVFCSFCWHL